AACEILELAREGIVLAEFTRFEFSIRTVDAQIGFAHVPVHGGGIGYDRELHGERIRLRMMPAAGDLDGTDIRIIEFAMNDVDAARNIFIARGAHRTGHAPQRDAVIDVVNQEIEGAAAAAGGIGETGTPVRSGAAPPEKSGTDGASVAED